MPDSKRTRIMLLILAGALLIGGVNVWQNSQVAKQEEIISQMPRKKHQRVTVEKQTEVKQTVVTEFKTGAAEPLRPPVAVAGQQTIPTTTTMTGTTQPLLPAAAPAPPTKIAATARSEAQVPARQNAGRKDPFLGITGLKPFPSHGITLEEEETHTISKNKRMLVPPPPPVVQTYAHPSIPSTEMPEPPSRPMLSHKVRLVAVLADRAVLKITDIRLRHDNKWPATITLGTGDKFESLEVLRVAPDSVTIEEDGERSVKTLDRIR